jgi:hypothetical protein
MPVAATRDVLLSPPATAMVWLGQDRHHEAIAVPGVRLSEGDVLVEVELSTVCGSDVHTVSGHRAAPTPLVLGHEYVGRVVAVLDEVRSVDGTPIRVGDRVVWSIMTACGRCDRCARALPQKCRDVRKYGHERLTARGDPLEDLPRVRPEDCLDAHPGGRLAAAEQRERVIELVGQLGMPRLRLRDLVLGPLHAVEDGAEALLEPGEDLGCGSRGDGGHGVLLRTSD